MNISRRNGLGAALLVSPLVALGPLSTLAAKQQRAVTLETPFPRFRVGFSKDWAIPKVKTVTLLPFDTNLLQESADFTLMPDNMIRVNRTGLYRALLGIDWVAQQGFDIDRRMIGIRRKKVGAPGGVWLQDDRLGSIDTPGSNAPATARYQGSWFPGNIPFGGSVSTEVTVANAGTVNIGDTALASHTGISDSKIGESANSTLVLQARVVDKDRVRVTISNPSISGGIVVPQGELRVLAMSTVDTRGESNDAWNVLNCPLEILQEGEMIYGVCRILVPGDFIQATNTTFIQLERFA